MRRSDEKTKTIFILSIVIISLSIISGYLAGYYIYKEHKEKAAYLDEQIQSILYRFGRIENDLIGLYSDLDENKIERKKVLLKLEDIRGDIEEWKNGYKTTVLRLRSSIEDMKVDRLTRTVERLQDEINRFKMMVQDLDMKIDSSRAQAIGSGLDINSIDLGRISVKKEDKK